MIFLIFPPLNYFKSNTSVGKDLQKREPTYTIGGNVNWCTHCGKEYGELPYDLAVPLLGIYTKYP